MHTLPVSFPKVSAFFLIPFQHRSYFLYFHCHTRIYGILFSSYTISNAFEISETAILSDFSFSNIIPYALTPPVTDMRTADCFVDAIIPKDSFQSYMQNINFFSFFHTVLFQLKIYVQIISLMRGSQLCILGYLCI